MNWMVWTLVVLLVLVLLLKKSKEENGIDPAKEKEKKEKRYLQMTVPKGLGLVSSAPSGMKQIEENLQEALSQSYIDKVKARVMADHPEIGSFEFDFLLAEMKRYFALSAIMKNAPMYSPRVDIIWHEMLMFTKEYAQFCEVFAGEMIHHIPNMDKKPNPTDRALFDFVYTNLFEVTAFTTEVYGNFFVQKMDRSDARTYAAMSARSLFGNIFNEKDPQQVGTDLSKKMFDMFAEADREAKASRTTRYSRVATGGIAVTTGKGKSDLSSDSSSFLYYSLYDDSSSSRHHHSSSSSSDSSSSRHSGSHHSSCSSSSHHSGGHSCSSHSCSSGSSCGSSCGS